MRYYISDLHFSHNHIEEVDHRGFSSTYEMNEYMIQQWNSRVTDKDEVYVLGDFSWAKGIETWKILNQLNGQITLIEGNHDAFFLDDPEFVDSRLEEVTSYLEDVDGRKHVILSHYPQPFYNHQFNTDEDGMPEWYMLYGHVHNTYDEYLLNQFINFASKQKRENALNEIVHTPFHMINCFCVYSNYIPLTLNEWIELDQKRRDFINSKGNMNYQDWNELNKTIVELSKNGWSL